LRVAALVGARAPLKTHVDPTRFAIGFAAAVTERGNESLPPIPSQCMIE
jgi:hypothetical protein